MYSFASLEPVHCSMSGSNCCFLTCIQKIWYSHLFKNFPQFVVIHTVKGFSILSEAEVDVFFWNSLAFSIIQQMLAIWSVVPLPFLDLAWTCGISQFMYCWSLAWGIFSITLLECEVSRRTKRKGMGNRWQIFCGLGDQIWPCTAKEVSLSLTYSISTLGRWPCLFSIPINCAVCCGH